MMKEQIETEDVVGAQLADDEVRMPPSLCFACHWSHLASDTSADPTPHHRSNMCCNQLARFNQEQHAQLDKLREQTEGGDMK